MKYPKPHFFHRTAALPLLLAAGALSAEPALAVSELDIFPFVTVETDVIHGDTVKSVGHFGYNNTSSAIAIGVLDNVFNWFARPLGAPLNPDQGQNVLFQSGIHEDVFTVTFDADTPIAWYMGQETEVANSVTARAEDGISYVRPVMVEGNLVSSYNHSAADDENLALTLVKRLVVTDGGTMNFAGGDYNGYTFRVGGGNAPSAVNFAAGTLTLEQDLSPQNPVLGGGILTIEDGGEFRALGGTLDILRLDVKPGGRFIGSAPTIDAGSSIIQGQGEMVFIDTTLQSALNVAPGSATNIVGDVHFDSLVFGPGNFFGSGTAHFNGGYNPGASPSVIEHENSIDLGSGNTLEIELAGTALGEFDRLEILGNLTLDGMLDVILIDGFTLSPSQTFEILNVVGTRSGQFIGLDEGGLVGSIGGTDLFISYTAGDGNDIALYTPIPEPASAAVLAMGVIGLLRRHRCRLAARRG